MHFQQSSSLQKSILKTWRISVNKARSDYGDHCTVATAAHTIDGDLVRISNVRCMLANPFSDGDAALRLTQSPPSSPRRLRCSDFGLRDAIWPSLPLSLPSSLLRLQLPFSPAQQGMDRPTHEHMDGRGPASHLLAPISLPTPAHSSHLHRVFRPSLAP